MSGDIDVPDAPEASCLCAIQGSIQAHIRPGIWIPGVRSPHLYEETWTVSANPIVCAQDVLQAVSQLRSRSLKGTVFIVSYVKEDPEKSSLEILVYSRLRYVYVLQLNFEAEPAIGCIAKARAFASGIMPAWFPLGFIFSCLLFFVPFYDGGRSAKWLNILRNTLTIPVEVKKSGRKC